MSPTPIWPAFADLRAITEAWDEAAAGFDPLRMDGDAPRYNYPRPWLLGGKLGGRSDAALWLGVTVAGIFLGMVFAVSRVAPGWTPVLILGLVASPAICLGLERGNTDLLIFALITPALLAGGSKPGWRNAWPPWLVILAAVLKLFPVVALTACLIRAYRTLWISATIGMAAFGCYLIATHADIGVVLAKTEHGREASYGFGLATEMLAGSKAEIGDAAAAIPASRGSSHVLHWIVAALLLTALALAAWPQARTALLGAAGKSVPVPESAIRLFVGGTIIYVVTFLFAQSWAYRLVFLIWTLPLLGHELRHGGWPRRVWSGATLLLIGLACWLITSNSAAHAWWAHLACLVLPFPLLLLSGASVGKPPKLTNQGMDPGQIIFNAAGVLLIVGTIAMPSSSRNLASPISAEAWSLFLTGKANAVDGQLPEARASLEAALRLHPDYADAHAQLGAVLWQTGQDEEALRHLEQSISLQPRAIEARNTLAGIQRQQRRWDEAIAGYEQSLSIRPNHVSTLNQLGLACLEAGRADQAHEWLERAQRIEPGNAATERNLGIVAASLGQLPEAIVHFERAMRFKPDYADAELQWGFALARAGRLNEALQHLQQAVQLAPESGRAHFVLAMAFRSLGRTAESEAQLREAIRLDPSLAPR